MKEKIRLENSAHMTECTVIPKNNFLSETQIRRANKKLCGSPDCKCGGVWRDNKFLVPLKDGGAYIATDKRPYPFTLKVTNTEESMIEASLQKIVNSLNEEEQTPINPELRYGYTKGFTLTSGLYDLDEDQITIAEEADIYYSLWQLGIDEDNAGNWGMDTETTMDDIIYTLQGWLQ